MEPASYLVLSLTDLSATGADTATNTFSQETISLDSAFESIQSTNSNKSEAMQIKCFQSV